MLNKNKKELTSVQQEIQDNSNLAFNTFQKLVKNFSGLSKEQLQTLVSQIGNFTDLATTYIDHLGDSLKKNNELVLNYQTILGEQLKNEEDVNVRLEILKDLKALQKQVNRQIILDKMHLDKVAVGGGVIISAVLYAYANKNTDNKENDL